MDSGELTLLGVVNVLLKQRRRIILFAGVIAMITAGRVLTRQRTYSSTVSFLPQGGQRTPSQLGGIAAQFGVDVGGGNPTASPQFYAKLTESRHLLGRIADDSLGDGRTKRTPAQIYETEHPNPAVQRELTIRALQNDITSVVDARTSIVSFTVTAPSPAFARAIAAAVLNALSQFNMETRQSQARSERLFAENQLKQAQDSLRRAEDDLEAFLQSNRVLSAPSLMTQRDRLGRKVSLQNQIYAQLAGSYEQAKLDEVRDTPVLTVLDGPEAPIEPNPRGLVSKTILAFLIAILLASAFSVLLDRLRADGGPTSEVQEFHALRREALGDLRNPLRLMRKRAS